MERINTLSENYQIIQNPTQREVIKRRAIALTHASYDQDMVIFLDKSARPLFQLMYSLYPIFYPDQKKPEVRFINLGREKVMRTIIYMNERPTIYANTRHTISSVCRDIYGVSNELYVLVSAGQGLRHLIVDDVVGSGSTMNLARKMLSSIDLKGNYSSFIFIDNVLDAAAFGGGDKNPATLPWYFGGTLVGDPEPDSFLCRPTQSRVRGLQIKKELNLLIAEVIKEPSFERG